ncbi:MAG: hypothetical protein L0Y71_15460 [Gemmataceae bacterium]|nr:hypothetical protein [Gemmataceae bacterium]
MQNRPLTIVAIAVAAVAVGFLLLYLLWPGYGTLTLDKVESATKGEATGEGTYQAAPGWVVANVEVLFTRADADAPNAKRLIAPGNPRRGGNRYKAIGIELVSGARYRVEARMQLRQGNGTRDVVVVAPQVRESQ